MLTGSATGSDFVHPAGGVDTVHTGGGNDTVVVYDLCELSSGEVLDGGSGSDTLVIPVSLAQVQLRGVSVIGFENVVVQANQRHLALCN